MKIAFFVDAFPVATETFVALQIAGLVARGHDVTIYSMGRHDVEPHAAIVEHKLLEKTVYLNDLPKASLPRLVAAAKVAFGALLRNPAGTLRAINGIRQSRQPGADKGFNFLDSLFIALPQLGQPKFDVVHAQFGTLGPRVLQLNNATDIAQHVVTSFRGHDATQKQLGPTFYTNLFEQGSLFLPVSEALQDIIVELGCDRNKTAVLHSGIDLSTYQYLQTRDLPPRTQILTVARFKEMKGLEYAIECMGLLRDRGHEFDYRIIGDGPLRPELEAQIERLNLGDTVTLMGWQENQVVRDLLATTHVFLTPSVTASNGETEGIPNAVKEAMAVGVPVVSTFHGGIPELVEDGVSGHLVAERDAQGLADKIAQVIDNPAACETMRVAARAHIEKEYEIEAMTDRLLHLYSNL